MNGIRVARERGRRSIKIKRFKGGLKRKLGTGSSSAEVQSRRFLTGDANGRRDGRRERG